MISGNSRPKNFTLARTHSKSGTAMSSKQEDAKKFIKNNQTNDRKSGRKAVNNKIPETNNNLCKFNFNAQDQRLPNYISRADQQPDRQFQHIDNRKHFVPRKTPQPRVTSSINLPKIQPKSVRGKSFRWHDCLIF